MTSTYILFSLIAYLFVAMMLILATGYRGMDFGDGKDASSDRPGSRPRPYVVLTPGFFGPGPERRSPAVGLDEESLASIESFLKEERDIVASFIDKPTPENLYMRSGAGRLLH